MKKFFQIRPTKTVLSIIITIIIGFLIGIFSTNTLPKTVFEHNSSFSLNYWYFFVLWFFGMIPFGFCLSYFITFFKSFMIGVTLGVCLKSSAMFGIMQFITYAILEGIIILPTLIYLANKSIKFSINGRRTFNDTGQKYFNVLVRVTIVIMIYALLTCLKMTFLEVQ